MGADKSLVFPISPYLICSTTKRIFLGWVREVTITKSEVCGAQGGICKHIFSIPLLVALFIKPKTYQPTSYSPRHCE
jgi:hypothetical protein